MPVSTASELRLVYDFSEGSRQMRELLGGKGAGEAMPGMLDTVLNLGLGDEAVASLIAATDEERKR